MDLALRKPVALSLLAILVYSGLAWGLRALLEPVGWSRTAVALTGQFLLAGYVSFLLQRLGWWGECGFQRKVTGRTILVFTPWLLIPLLQLTDVGMVTSGPARIAVFAFWALLVGFGEEALLRGVVLRALRPGGVMRAAVLSSVLFGIAHLANVLEGRDLFSTLVQVVYAAFIGIGFAGPVVATGAIWPAIVVHALIDFTDAAGRDFTFPDEGAALYPGQAVVALALTGLYALYGIWLIRRHLRSTSTGI
ncbi:MAG: lysostaphin resistance A-like protein [Candidatus Krumholzibacteriia bacterium]